MIDSRDARVGHLNDKQQSALQEAAEYLKAPLIRVYTPPRATIAQIRAAAKRMKTNLGLSLLVIDYLGLVRPAADERRLPRHEQIQEFTSSLKGLAKELDIAVILLCQLNREADGAEPRLSHLRDSGAIDQDADMVVFIRELCI